MAILLAALTAIWVYRDAKSRGLSAGLWALVALLGQAPVGLLVYLLIGRKDAPVVTKPVKGMPYLIAGILCFVIMIGSSVAFVTHAIVSNGADTGWSGVSVGSVETNWNGEWSMHYHYCDRTHTKRVNVPEGSALIAGASCLEGEITLLVTAGEFSELFHLSGGETAHLTFPPDPGRSYTSVRLLLVCDRARDGDVMIRWK